MICQSLPSEESEELSFQRFLCAGIKISYTRQIRVRSKKETTSRDILLDEDVNLKGFFPASSTLSVQQPVVSTTKIHAPPLLSLHRAPSSLIAHPLVGSHDRVYLYYLGWRSRVGGGGLVLGRWKPRVHLPRNYQLPFLRERLRATRTHNNALLHTMRQCLQCKHEPLENLNSIPVPGGF